MCSLVIGATTVLESLTPFLHMLSILDLMCSKSLNPCAKNMGKRMRAAASAQPSKGTLKPGARNDLGAE